MEDEVSYARNVSFIDDDLDEGELGTIKGEPVECGIGWNRYIKSLTLKSNGLTFGSSLFRFTCHFSWCDLLEFGPRRPRPRDSDQVGISFGECPRTAVRPLGSLDEC